MSSLEFVGAIPISPPLVNKKMNPTAKKHKLEERMYEIKRVDIEKRLKKKYYCTKCE